MAPSRTKLQAVAEDTLTRVDKILHSVREGSLDSTFISSQLPPLPPLENTDADVDVKVEVQNIDSFRAARHIMREFPETAVGSTTVLNLASDEYRAGGWLESLYVTQEEALCYSSTLYPTLKEEYYPWVNLGPSSVAGIYSPAVVIFKDDLDHDCIDLPSNEIRVVSVITVAAPRGPMLTADRTKLRRKEDLECFREKIRLVYRMAAHNNQKYLVLGAMGCGAYRCPPRQVAEEMKAILLAPEFYGRFHKIVFAVYSTGRNPNFDIFHEVLDGVKLTKKPSKKLGFLGL